MGEITVLATGDVGPVHGPSAGRRLENYASAIRPVLAEGDVRFGNCERQYSTSGYVSDRSPHGRQSPEMAEIFKLFDFNVLNLANNHMYDYGPSALLDTRSLMLSMGIAVTGAGATLEEACKPAIVETGGGSVGLLGFCSIERGDNFAGVDKPGVAPLRVHAAYEIKGPHDPVRVRTRPDSEDLDRILGAVQALKRQVDIVVVAFHWGAIWVPRVVCDYQVEVAHACAEAGADMIVGHHPHLLKAVEAVRDCGIFYSLGNLCMTKPSPAAAWNTPPWQQGALRNFTDLDPDRPLLPYGRYAKFGGIAKLGISGDGCRTTSLIPFVIGTDYCPRPIVSSSDDFGEVVTFLEWTSEGFGHMFEPEDGEIQILRVSARTRVGDEVR